jgi:hypothetical protein
MVPMTISVSVTPRTGSAAKAADAVISRPAASPGNQPFIGVNVMRFSFPVPGALMRQVYSVRLGSELGHASDVGPLDKAPRLAEVREPAPIPEGGQLKQEVIPFRRRYTCHQNRDSG